MFDAHVGRSLAGEQATPILTRPSTSRVSDSALSKRAPAAAKKKKQKKRQERTNRAPVTLYTACSTWKQLRRLSLLRNYLVRHLPPRKVYERPRASPRGRRASLLYNTKSNSQHNTQRVDSTNASPFQRMELRSHDLHDTGVEQRRAFQEGAGPNLPTGKHRQRQRRRR